MKKLLFFPFLFLLVMMFTGASGEGCSCTTSPVNQSDVNIKTSAEGWTAEQINIKKRAEVASDPQKVWWIYCLAENGQVVFYGAVKGKATSSQKYISGIDFNGVDVSGESDAYVYWFDPAGVYYQWSGDYFLTSAEVRVATPVINTRNLP